MNSLKTDIKKTNFEYFYENGYFCIPCISSSFELIIAL